MRNIGFLLFFIAVTIVSCKPKSDKEDTVGTLIPISEKALNDSTSIFYADYKNYPKDRNSLPLGVFDSGTGGLTVLEAMLSLDEFNNKTGKSGADGIADFTGEKFVYLADQVNMPYGNYAAENKTDYLKELIIKDALFLTSPSIRSKLVVVACNTATAYGLADIDNLLKKGKTGIHVIGVINAAVSAALDNIPVDKESAVGVMATVGTIASGGYERTIREYAKQRGMIIPDVINQGGKGFAEAVDGEYDFVDKSAVKVRDNYRGPVLGDDTLSIKSNLLGAYNFDRTSNALLVKMNGSKIEAIQLNSPGNYARYHLVTLLDKYIQKGNKVKIGTIILGCTHYPYFADTLNKCLNELRGYSENGKFPFREILADKVSLIDPAKNVAIEAYKYLKDNGLVNEKGSVNSVEPYITVPAKSLSTGKLDKLGNFKYEFKYGRSTGTEDQTFDCVLFSKKNINSDNLARIKSRLPLTFSYIKSFTE